MIVNRAQSTDKAIVRLLDRALAVQLSAAVLGGCIVSAFPGSGLAQDAKELMGRSQSQSQQKAVEELIRKLQGSTAAKPALPAPAGPPPAPVPAAAVPMPSPPATVAAPVSPVAPAEPAPPQPPPQQVVVTPAAPVAAPPVPEPASAEPAVAKPSSPPLLPPVAAAPTAAPTPAETARIDELPSIDIEIYFDYNSDRITSRAAETLATVARALNDPRLARARFLIAGHTDAAGGAEFNLDLSTRRAASVRRFLIDRQGLAEDRLVSRGFGLQRLKNPQRPMAVENRRVQIVNLTGSDGK